MRVEISLAVTIRSLIGPWRSPIAVFNEKVDVICAKVIKSRKARVHITDHKFLLHRQIDIITVAPTTKLWHLLQQMNINVRFERSSGRNAVNGTTIIPIRHRNFSILFKQV